MKKLLLPTFFISFLFIFSSFAKAQSLAQSLGITSIGGVSTTGTISTWSHQGFNPLFVGTASPSAMVRIEIGSAVNSTAAAASGAWTYKPTGLNTVGTYPISITSGGQSILFTLGIAATGAASPTPTPTGTASALPATLPQTGSDDVLLLVASGLFLMVTGGYSGAYLLGYFREE